jgi:hypothetical protein
MIEKEKGGTEMKKGDRKIVEIGGHARILTILNVPGDSILHPATGNRITLDTGLFLVRRIDTNRLALVRF